LAAVDKHADLLRIAIAGASNDHRLGANEAPPAIISAFLGEDVDDAVKRFLKDEHADRKFDRRIDLGIPSLPVINRQATDRNRTSPFAFTGNKFEFRAVGSSQTPARSNIVLNTIMAESVRDVATNIQTELQRGKSAEQAMKKVARDLFNVHYKNIVFNGDNYSKEWHEEAKKRGLPNLKTTPEALAKYNSDKNVKLFEEMGVLKKAELISRQHVFQEEYKKRLIIEGKVMQNMVNTGVIPAVATYQAILAGSIGAAQNVKSGVGAQANLLNEISERLNKTITAVKALEHHVHHGVHKADGDPAAEASYCEREVLPAMQHVREHVDALEGLVCAKSWPFPTYRQMLFDQD